MKIVGDVNVFGNKIVRDKFQGSRIARRQQRNQKAMWAAECSRRGKNTGRDIFA
jgi:hypothetical protein